MLKVLCHACGWCSPSKAAFTQFKKEMNSHSHMHSYRFDGANFKEHDEDIISTLLIPVLISYNENVFDQLYSKYNVDKYDVPSKFDIPLKSIRNSNTKIIKGHFNFYKKIVNNLQEMLKDRNGSLVTILITLSYSPSCNELDEYMPFWNKIKKIVKMYNFGSIIMKQQHATNKGVNLPFTTFKLTYETESLTI